MNIYLIINKGYETYIIIKNNMKLQTIKEFVINMTSTNSTNEKLDILKTYANNDIVRDALFYTYHPFKNYYVKSANILKNNHLNIPNNYDLFQLLDVLNNRSITGHEAIGNINYFISCNEEFKDLILNIIDRTLEIRMDDKSINKVFPKLIPIIPYMRCSLMDKIKNIIYPAMVQQKADGCFSNILCVDNNIKFITRNGNEIILDVFGSKLKTHLLQFGVTNSVINGEFLVKALNGKALSRKEGNGLINSLIKKEQSTESYIKKIAEAKTEQAKIKLTKEFELKQKEWDDTEKIL